LKYDHRLHNLMPKDYGSNMVFIVILKRLQVLNIV